MNGSDGARLPRLVAVSIRNYRVLAAADVRLGPTTVIVGGNGAGKSTLLDAVAFVAEFMTFGLRRAVGGGGSAEHRQRALSPRDLLTNRKGSGFEMALTFDMTDVPDLVPELGLSRCRYELAVGVGRGEPFIEAERVWLHADDHASEPRSVRSTRRSILWPEPRGGGATSRRATVREKGRVVHYDEKGEHPEGCRGHRIAPDESALALRSEFDARYFPRTYALQKWAERGVATLRLDGETIRVTQPAATYRGLDVSSKGEYLTGAVRWLQQRKPSEYRAWVENAKLALPELKDFRVHTQRGDGRRYLAALLTSGAEVSSYALSEGTLRILALTILPHLEQLPSSLLVEEPEVSVHPQGIETVMQALSSMPDTQVLITTQSALVMVQRPLSEVVIARRRRGGGAEIVPASTLPDLQARLGKIGLETMFGVGMFA